MSTPTMRETLNEVCQHFLTHLFDFLFVNS